jgi:glycosyltransferase involved in cell wall biosynthesis
MSSLGATWEVIYVDDCSTDRSLRVMLDLRKTCEQVRIVKFRRNYGQTAAMAAGFDVSRGEVVVTLDGDLQNDPGDIPRLVEELQRGYDMVAGWRKERHDGFVLRRLPSVVANRLIAVVSGVRIHDTGCTLKAFRRELVKNMPIYAEQHRFLPLMSSGSGARVSELVVHHRPRRFGRSKFGAARFINGFLDLISAAFLSTSGLKPLHVFGRIGLASLLAGLLMGLFFVAQWLGGEPMRVRPLMLFGAGLVLLGVLLVLMGLLGEMIVHSAPRREYPTRSRLNLDGDA